MTIAVSSFQSVAAVAREAAARVRGMQDQTLRYYFHQIETIALMLDEQLQTANVTRQIDVPKPTMSSPRVDKLWFDVLLASKIEISANALKACRAIVGDDVESVVVQVDRQVGKGRQEFVRRTIVVTQKNHLPEDAVVILNDATGNLGEIEKLVGRPVVDLTPSGKVEQRHEVLQVPVDIKQGTARSGVLGAVRGLLAKFPESQRNGVITHQKHAPAIAGTARKGEVLEESLRDRIAMVSHFGSSVSRGSNLFPKECDRLIVVGTPRVPPSVIARRLIALGNVEAAARDGKWATDWWSGRDQSGRRHTIKTLNYCDHDWYAAHRAVVAAELKQAIGRARSICDHGIPVIVLTTEDLGLTLADWPLVPVTSGMMGVLKVVADLTGLPHENNGPAGSPSREVENETNPYLSNLGNCFISPHEQVASATTSAIASSASKTHQYSSRLLGDLADAGLVRKAGHGHWVITDAGLSFTSPQPRVQEF
jgi:hypothetical protein